MTKQAQKCSVFFSHVRETGSGAPKGDSSPNLAVPVIIWAHVLGVVSWDTSAA